MEEDETSKKDKTNMINYLIGGVTLMGILLTSYLVINKNKSSSGEKRTKIGKNSNNKRTIKEDTKPPPEIIIDKSEIVESVLIGEGNYGKVYEGII